MEVFLGYPNNRLIICDIEVSIRRMILFYIIEG
jgi:hypothetical protein